jgi:hypothetical protein
MQDRPRWVLALVVVVVIAAFIAVARGREHHRGDDVGALGNGASRSQIQQATGV